MRFALYWGILLFFTAMPAGTSAEGPVTVIDPWILAAPPNARVIAAYMKIENVSDSNVVLWKVSGNNFRKVEIHRTIRDGDIMKMAPQKELIIPAGTVVKLEPLGYHLMLIDPASVPKEGESEHMKLFFNNGIVLEVTAAVRRADYFKRNPSEK